MSNFYKKFFMLYISQIKKLPQYLPHTVKTSSWGLVLLNLLLIQCVTFKEFFKVFSENGLLLGHKQQNPSESSVIGSFLGSRAVLSSYLQGPAFSFYGIPICTYNKYFFCNQPLLRCSTVLKHLLYRTNLTYKACLCAFQFCLLSIQKFWHIVLL